jgi:predicted dehydrogenase
VRLTIGASKPETDLDRPEGVCWKPESGGGALWDVSGYPVSHIRWAAGEPEEVFGWQVLAQGGVVLI